ncbi:MAG TPA: YbdK family carboxylate-amine ligase [Solirubrobacteraceae bacterium]|nr:YbdK family carboxylate-amine ligase [Solirubrobacteraceae bacterium]
MRAQPDHGWGDVNRPDEEGRAQAGESSLSLADAEDIFAEAADLTVGIEEELAILDPVTLDLVPRFEELTAAARNEDPVLLGSISGELIASEIEIRSGRAADLHDALASQRDARRRLFVLAEAHGAALGATGTHPFADYRQQRNIDTQHYRRVVEDLQYVARRNNTFSLHVHVGVRDLDRAVRVSDRLRPLLPLLLAVSASSPFLDGVDAGLHSARTQSFTKQFPRCGVPDAYGSWEAYRAYLEVLVGAGSIVEGTQVWWSVRPHLAFGTVEVRICDAQPTASESDDLAGLIVACVAQAARDVDEGVPWSDPPGRLVEENLWRAIRYGLDGHMLEIGAPSDAGADGGRYPAAAIVERLAAWTAPARAELDWSPDLPVRNSAQRQRELITDGLDPRAVYASTVRETVQTYPHPQEVNAA